MLNLRLLGEKKARLWLEAVLGWVNGIGKDDSPNNMSLPRKRSHGEEQEDGKDA